MKTTKMEIQESSQNLTRMSDGLSSVLRNAGYDLNSGSKNTVFVPAGLLDWYKNGIEATVADVVYYIGELTKARDSLQKYCVE